MGIVFNSFVIWEGAIEFMNFGGITIYIIYNVIEAEMLNSVNLF